ncbi:MAG: hypothetical protein PHY03_07010 [Dehalococcoidia bacterium]|nr:hypothetical protein [Dehalococcoidia bacterium]
MDPVVLTNFILCVIILGMGVWEYIRTKSRVELYVGIAFGLFGVSHLLTLLGLSVGLTVPLIIIRLLAYLLVIFGLYTVIARRKKKA